MKTPHKHAKIIKAWADGEKIEYFNTTDNKWEPIFKGWSWDSSLHIDIRVKLDPKKDQVVLPFTATYRDVCGYTMQVTVRDQLKLTFDGETGKLKSAEVL